MFDKSAQVYDVLYSFKDYGAESAELATLIRRRRPEARSLLDVACGTGRHLEFLRGEFPDVAGVDIEPALLQIARERLPGVQLVEADMRSFDLQRRFDAVTCLFSAVGYLADAEELATAVAMMAEHLSPAGVLIIDGWVKPDAWRPGVNVDALTGVNEDLAAARVSRTWRDGDRTHLEMRYLIGTAEGFDQVEEHHTLTLFSDAEYRAAFERAGLEAEVVASPMGPDRDRYVAVS